MMTRKEYMSNYAKNHRQYFADFVTPSVIKMVKQRIGLKRILSSTDEHFNNIPLKEWDSLYDYFKPHIAKINKEKGNKHTTCYSDNTCMLKEAAKQIKESIKLQK